MNALLIISHGSRRQASNNEVFALTETLRGQAAGMMVACAFLEIAEPTVQRAIDDLAESGANKILVFPHFLAAGTHVARDIPNEIRAAKEKYPDITFTPLPHLGALPGLPALVFSLLGES